MYWSNILKHTGNTSKEMGDSAEKLIFKFKLVLRSKFIKHDTE